jgi:glutamyl-Q tRNA(Asp) synthetase
MILVNSVLTKVGYRGRFAPTPSGPLHMGSLLTALASYLAARSRSGVWLLRIDDLDRARTVAGMEARILRQLEDHGLLWDEAVRRQGQHLDEYRAALDELDRQGLLYLCTCTRQQLRQAVGHGPDGPVYAGTCRGQGRIGRGALRIHLPGRERCFDDGWQGRQCRQMARDIGDFVVRRANGEFAYQLACAVDEHAQAISEVVRGADLLGSTFQQRYLQERLGYRSPAYRHLPVLVDESGRKLSKQNRAAAVGAAKATPNLYECLVLLGQEPPEELQGGRAEEVLRWGVAHWNAAKIPGGAQIVKGIPYNALQQSPADAQ